jgi:muramoyltetrapeptide carboxypeptidase
MRPPLLKAPRLRPGDTVGVVSSSWGGAGTFPHRTERGVAHLEALGYQVKLGRHALNTHGFVSDTPEHRVSDLHELFLDPSVRLILAAIGGDHSCHLLPLLDFDLIRKNPKAVVGFSDITVLNVAIWQASGVVTFNGPALLTDLPSIRRCSSIRRAGSCRR